MNNLKKVKSTGGITLVALIITIIVLLILAVVAIRAVQDGGIIQHAQNARDEYIIGQQKENELLRNYLIYLEENASETPHIVHNNTIPLGGKYITHTEEGEEVVYESTENNYVEFPKEVKNGDIYQYGDYEYAYNMSCKGSTGAWEADESQDGWGTKVINRDKTSYGNILTTINGKDITCLRATFYNCINLISAPSIPSTVKNMKATFNGASALVNAPVIPNGVVNMSSTFGKCSSLVTAPSIPDSVTNMYCTFSTCISLTTAPTIGNGVTDMSGTFQLCTALVTAPEIPSSVTNISGTFRECTSLTGNITINAVSSKVGTNYTKCFYLTEKDIWLIGNDTELLNNLKGTANGNVDLAINK